MKCAIVGKKETIFRVFNDRHFAALASKTDLFPEIVDQLEKHLPELHEIEVIVSTWGMPNLSEEQLDRLPNLRLVLYAAGDVRGFALPLIQRGILVSSAWRANAIPVAEFTLAHILMAGKAYLRNVSDYARTKTFGTPVRGSGNCGETVAILGAGAIGSLLIEFLKPFQWTVVVFDPFLSSEEADRVGVRKVSIEEAFELGRIVTNHLADNLSTKGMIDARLFNRLAEGATFINTGRGQTVVQPDFIEVFRNRPDLTAVLDVTDPEPLPKDSPIWGLPNVFVSTHIAGSMGNELGRMADICLEELDRYLGGYPILHAVPAIGLEP